ncbi:MAG: SDR family oxidoreductase [Gemmataceae bacterium]|nr:SDR family oxidoreductase [Gemmataceae bacterium]
MDRSTKKVLVVGGAGYVGCVLVPELLERGYAVKVFDRLYYGDQGLKGALDRIELVVDDMRAMTADVLEDVDAVINLGGLSNDPTAEYNPRANHEMNTVATESLARLCKQAGVRRYLFASSCSIYDIGEGNDEKDILLDETSPVEPKAAYSSSKFAAERVLLEMADERFCPVMLRKGTVYGFSPRMRYDLVVNTFVKDGLSKGYMTPFSGGEMWRPMVDVRDAAKAYITCLQAPEEKVHAQIFNVVHRNFRISELALRVREGLRQAGHKVDIHPDYRYKGVRNYRVSGKKLEHTLDYRTGISVEGSVVEMVENIKKYGFNDFDNPRYYNIRWMKVLEEADKTIKITGSVFEGPSRPDLLELNRSLKSVA